MEEEQSGKNTSSSIAFISSPLQIVCLNELLNIQKIENLMIVVITISNSDENINQIKKVAKNLQIKISNIFCLNNRLNYFKLFYKYAFKRKNILILGAYYNSAFYILGRIINFNKLFFIDDGLETAFIGRLNVANEFLISKLFKWKYSSSGIHFSFFKDLNIKYLSHNNFLHLKSKIKNKTINDLVFLLGSNFIESNMLTFNQYQNYITKVKSRYSPQNIFYMPHRRELASNYNRYGLKILKPEVCFEIYLTTLDFLPKCILGFYSTALITSKIILSKINKTEIINIPIRFNENDDERKLIYNKVLIKNNIKDF